MGKGLIAVIVVIVIVGLIAVSVFGSYVNTRNTLVQKNEAVKSAWSQVDIVLQRRADLIPNLVETVKGYAQQEQTVFGISLRHVPPCFPQVPRSRRSQPTVNWTEPWAACF